MGMKPPAPKRQRPVATAARGGKRTAPEVDQALPQKRPRQDAVHSPGADDDKDARDLDLRPAGGGANDTRDASDLGPDLRGEGAEDAFGVPDSDPGLDGEGADSEADEGFCGLLYQDDAAVHDAACSHAPLPPDARALAAALRSPPPPMHHEGQQLALCGVHALNMAVGEPYFCDHDFQLALNVRLREAAAEGLHERRSDHTAPGGFRGGAANAPSPTLARPFLAP